jgi:hypothetical protein
MLRTMPISDVPSPCVWRWAYQSSVAGMLKPLPSSDATPNGSSPGLERLSALGLPHDRVERGHDLPRLDRA